MIKNILVYFLISQATLILVFLVALKIHKWIFRYDPPSYISMPVIVAPAFLLYFLIITPLMLFTNGLKDGGGAYIGILISLYISLIAISIFGFIKLRQFLKDLKAWEVKKKAEREARLRAQQEELDAANELYAAIKGINPEEVTEKMINEDFDKITKKLPE